MPVPGRALGFSILLVLSFKVLARRLSPADSGFLLAVLDGANLIFHEAGHVIFLFGGEFLQYLGGSLTQVALPAALAAYFWMHGQRASAAVTLFWMGENLTNVAIYIADAQKMELPLIGGDHDWNYLLDRLSLLHRAESIGWLVFFWACSLSCFLYFSSPPIRSGAGNRRRRIDSCLLGSLE